MSSPPRGTPEAADIVVAEERSRRRILVVEGSESLRQTLRRMLEVRHHRVILVGAEEAFKVWGQRGADLLILDLSIPGMDSLEAIVQFHAAAADLPIIVMSAGHPRRGYEVLDDALRLGAVAALPKPFGLLRLLELVSKVLGTDVNPG